MKGNARNQQETGRLRLMCSNYVSHNSIMKYFCLLSSNGYYGRPQVVKRQVFYQKRRNTTVDAHPHDALMLFIFQFCYFSILCDLYLSHATLSRQHGNGNVDVSTPSSTTNIHKGHSYGPIRCRPKEIARHKFYVQLSLSHNTRSGVKPCCV